MPRELAIFPLPIVLFPGAIQPLHIFEPRYRRLLADCLDGDRRFGINYVADAPSPDDPVPKPGQVGCIARIRETAALADGRSNIITEGERRYDLLEWVPGDHPYRVARVEEFDDFPEEAGEAESVAVGVRRDFSRLVAALAVLTDRPADPTPLPKDPTALSFHIAATLELDPQDKVTLLGLRSTIARLRRLAAVLAPLAADGDRRAAVRVNARGNGKSGLRPEIERRPP